MTGERGTQRAYSQRDRGSRRVRSDEHRTRILHGQN